MSQSSSTIVYTLTDEAPLLATASFLPIIRTFTAPAGVDVITSDISVAARILGAFPECLTEAQRVPDTLAELGKLTLRLKPTSSSCPTSAPRCRSSRPPSSNCRAKGYAHAGRIRTTPKDRRRKRHSSARYDKCQGLARSTRCCAKATPIAARRAP